VKKLTYYEMLKHPKWQKKRLEILEREDFSCAWCENDKDNQLHVHHMFYDNDMKLWEYPDHTMVCLCSVCHKAAHDLKKRLEYIVADSLEGIHNYSMLIGIMAEMQKDIDGMYNYGIKDYGEVLGASMYRLWSKVGNKTKRECERTIISEVTSA